MLVMGKNMLVTFIGWEGVGLCSYLLIGYWYEDDANAVAGQKAFIVNRVGDFAFLGGLFLLFYQAGTFDYVELYEFATTAETARQLAPIALPAAVLIFIGCTGKSAQIPLYTWLPDAMAGPTPVSALIHAATMVTAGVFLIARLHFLFTFNPTIGYVVATIGTLTAFFAATIAVVQNDIKKVLAYSTISQLGYMFMAVGVGAFTAGVFHLMTHAFFKALLFLGSGSVIHAMGGTQDIREMGGLKKWMPHTEKTFLIACLAISGIFPLAGFFSKDLILWKALTNVHIFSVPEAVAAADISTLIDAKSTVIKSGAAVDVTTAASVFHWSFYVLGLVTAGLTAFYMFRLYFLTFRGECRADEETKDHLHESPPSMTLPLWGLAILSVVGGWTGWPHFVPKGWFGVKGADGLHAPESLSWMLGFEHWLDEVFTVSTTFRFAPLFGKYPFAIETVSALVSLGVAASGIGAAWWVYLKKPGLPKEIADSVSGLYEVLLNKYYVDELYDRVFVQGSIKIGSFMHTFDEVVIDGILVDGLAWFVEQIGKILRHLQSGNVQRYATYIALGIVLFALAIRYM
jgi:NADH-quinone oxidoreductase subunit L